MKPPPAGRKTAAANTLLERAACRKGDERPDRRCQRGLGGAVADCDLQVPDPFHRSRLGAALLRVCATGRRPNQRESHTQHYRQTTHVTRLQNCPRHVTLSFVTGYRRTDCRETPQSCLVTAHVTMERGWRESVDDLFLQPAADIRVVRS